LQQRLNFCGQKYQDSSTNQSKHQLQAVDTVITQTACQRGLSGKSSGNGRNITGTLFQILIMLEVLESPRENLPNFKFVSI
jgi:hypothetical protein